MIHHAPGPGGLFDNEAMCGIDAVGRVLCLTQVIDDVDCLVCLDLLRLADA